MLAIRKFWRYQVRYRLGRFLMHAGMRIMPEGRARSEISDLLWAWRAKVDAALAVHRHS